MTITTTRPGTNTVQLSIVDEYGSANIIAAIDAAITSCGWTQHDVFLNHLKVYKALNADGITYKYLGIHIDQQKFLIGTTSWESWNAVTHVGTNEVWTANRGYTMGYTTNSCDIIIMASTRWCILQTYIRNSPSLWSGVVEMQREFPEDTVNNNYPCWAWVNSQLIGADYDTNISHTTAGTFRNFSLPRTRGGAVGQAAAFNTSFITPFDRFGFGSLMNNTNLGLSFGQSKAGVLPETYPWDPTKKIVHTLRPRLGLTETHGRLFGIKGVAAQGYAPMNIANLNVDADFFYSPNGNPTDHWLLPTTALNSREIALSQKTTPPLLSPTQGSNGAFVANNPNCMYWGTTLPTTAILGSAVTFTIVGAGTLPVGIVPTDTYFVTSISGNNFGISAVLGGTPIVLPSVSSSATLRINMTCASGTESQLLMTARVRDCVSTGTYIYSATDAGLQKTDHSSKATQVVAGITDVSFNSVVYDGQYIWASGETRVWRIDTANSDAVAFTTNSGSMGQLWWSGSYIWCGARNSSTSPALVRINPTTLAITPVTGIPPFLVSQNIGGITSDNSGNVYAITSGSGTSASVVPSGSDQRVLKIVESTAAYSSQTTNVGPSDSIACYVSGIMFDGISLVTAYSSASVVVRRIDPTSMAITSTLLAFQVLPTTTSNQATSQGTIKISKMGPGYYISVPSVQTTGFTHTLMVWNLDFGANISSNVAHRFSTESPNFAYFDGNRIFGSTWNNYLVDVSNIIRPTNSGTTPGMWMLPK